MLLSDSSFSVFVRIREFFRVYGVRRESIYSVKKLRGGRREQK